MFFSFFAYLLSLFLEKCQNITILKENVKKVTNIKKVSVLQMERLGYSHLIESFSLPVLEQPLQCYLSTGTGMSREITPQGMEIHYPVRYRTDGSWQAHLHFAIRHEGVNLEVLKALFRRVDEKEMSALVLASPHSIYARRLWFLYEFLTGHELPIPPLKSGNYACVLPPEEYFCLAKDRSWNAKRQRLVCNLPGMRSSVQSSESHPAFRIISRRISPHG